MCVCVCVKCVVSKIFFNNDNDYDYENMSKLNLVNMYLIIDLKNLLIFFFQYYLPIYV